MLLDNVLGDHHDNDSDNENSDGGNVNSVN